MSEISTSINFAAVIDTGAGGYDPHPGDNLLLAGTTYNLLLANGTDAILLAG